MFLKQHLLNNSRKYQITCLPIQRLVSYCQGQEPEPRVREYFYYINHEGMLFLDDAKIKNFTSCFKEMKFLQFFFKRIKLNNIGRYQDEFPYLSLCGRERNYIRCDDTPIVFTRLQQLNDRNMLIYNHTKDLMIDFQPHKIYMNSDTGRLYHPCGSNAGNIALICYKLAIDLSKHLIFNNGEQNAPTHIRWNNDRMPLDTEWVTQNLLTSNLDSNRTM